MGKPLKRSDRDKPWAPSSREVGQRAIRQRDRRTFFLIVCEGEQTEPKYFEALGRELPRGSVEVRVVGTGRNTLDLVAVAIEKRQEQERYRPVDRTWVVLDRDSFPADHFDNAIAKAEAARIRCAWSNEAFELWFLLHFEDRTTGMVRTEYQKKLSGYLSTRYEKNEPEMLTRLQTRGDPSAAILRAKRLEARRAVANDPPSKANPCTTVFQLVEALQHPDAG